MSVHLKLFRVLSILLFSLTAFVNVAAQFTTQPGRFAYALNSAPQVFAITPDNKLAVSLENDPIATHPAFLTSFDPRLGTEFDHETFGFGPLEVRMAQTSAGLRVVVLTSEGGPRKVYLFDLAANGQLTQLAATQLTTSGADTGSNMVLSGNADVGFVVVAGGEFLTFSLLDGSIVNRFPDSIAATLALSEANGKRVVALQNGPSLRFLNVNNPAQPGLLGDVSLPLNNEFSAFSAAPPAFSGDGKFLFATSQFADFGVVDVDALKVISTIGGAFRFTRVVVYEDAQRRLLALQSSQSGTAGLSAILLIDATDPAHLVTLNQFSPTEPVIYKSGERFSKDGNILFVQTATKLTAYNLPSFTKSWEKTAPQAFREHQLEVYGDDEVIAAWEADAGLGFDALFGTFPRSLPDVSINDVNVNEGDVGSVNADFTVTLSAASTHRVTVSYSTADGTATQGADYVSKTASVVFQPGETSKTASIEILGDTIDEFSETVKVNLSNVDVGTIVRAQGTATILNNDPPPTISVMDNNVIEGDGAGNTVAFLITLSQVSEKPISIDFATADGTAVAGADYIASSGTVTIPAGLPGTRINVPIVADIDQEPTEAFTLNLSNPVNTVIAKGQATATIFDDDQPGIRFQSAQQFTNESITGVNIFVLRKGDLSVTATIDYQTSDTGSSSPCNATTGQASSRCDYLTTLGQLQFAPGESVKTIRVPVINDVFNEGPETFTLTLSNPSGAPLLAPSSTTITIIDNDFFLNPNPIDRADFFVREHYFDFLNRDPDASGFNFWTNEITSCNGEPTCVEIKRINVSAAFFLSIEFQETGYLVYRTYKTAFGNLAGKPVPVRLNEFLRDTQQIGRGVQVGVGDWQAQLEANKQAYALAFVQRPEFLAAYPNTLTADQFVTQLDTNAGTVLTAAEKANLVAMLGATPADITKRATVLRAVSENANLKSAETNKAFVLMQYFGYLRRNPDEGPDTDFSGYNFWLSKLNQFNGNFIQAEMVKAFISSLEYRQRFGP